MQHKLIPTRPTLHLEVDALFEDLALDLVACEACGDYHPPELHLRPLVPYDPHDPEEA